MKRKVLLHGESSLLNTGYSKMGQEILRRLHGSGRFEVVEGASYSPPADPRQQHLPWAYEPYTPDPNNPEEVARYNANPLNAFGAWKWEDVCLKYKCDTVVTFMDPWQVSNIFHSPLRPYYRVVYQPTADAEPLDEEWVDLALQADSVLGYTGWGLDLYRRQGGERLKAKGVASPGVDLDVFRVRHDKKAHRRKLGIDENALVVGTCMRSQVRKLFPDLFEAFALFLREAPRELANRTYLYCHTYWPDIAWDIPRLLNEAGIASKVVLTYHCKACRASFPSFFADCRTACRACGQYAATLVSSQDGIPDASLSEVYGLFDCLVQYATAEGLGLPQIEAAACGTHVFAVDYSAMSEVVRKVKGTPIRVERYYRDVMTGRKFALPDNADFARKLIDFLSLPEPVRAARGFEARRAAERHYSWDGCVQKWVEAIEELPPPQRSWDAPASLHETPREVPQHPDNLEWVNWCIEHVAGRPELAGSYAALKTARDLALGARLPGVAASPFSELSSLGAGQRYEPYDREKALQEFRDMAARRNYWEARRAGVRA